MSSYKKPLALFLLGLALILTGLTFKLNHLMGAETLFNGGAILAVVGLLWLALAISGSRSDEGK